MNTDEIRTMLRRRDFLQSAAASGAGLMLGPAVLAQAGRNDTSEAINVALIGAGEQGKTLVMDCLRIPSVRFKAVCEIWPYNRNWVSGRLRAYRHQHNCYEDYKEMLAQENDLDAVIIATPDCWHAEHTIACLEAGLHVYCEKEMSNKLADARRMVLAARKTGRLLQIGHQRRSNPRYIFCYEKILKEAKLLGQITAVNGQWNRAVQPTLGWPEGTGLDEKTLNRYGFDSMEQLRNWRWYKNLGGGPIVDLGSHQIDIYNWFLQARPTSVIASGRTNFYSKKTHEWYDTVMAIYEYATDQGAVTAFYQTISSNSSQGYFESFLGHEGTLVISEPASRCAVYREDWVQEQEWTRWVNKGYLEQEEGLEQDEQAESVGQIRTPSPQPAKYNLLVTMDKKFHQPQLENFFNAVRGKAKLNCPAEVGYETAVTVLKVNEAVQQGHKLDFEPGEFGV